MDPACRLDPIAELRQRVAALDAPARVGGTVAFGVAELDRRLADKGLAVGGLHEVAAAAPDLAEDAATTLFLAGIATRAAPSAPVLWVLTRFDLYAPGLKPKVIARRVQLSERTVYTHLGNAARKLGATGPGEAAVMLARHEARGAFAKSTETNLPIAHGSASLLDLLLPELS